MDLISVIVPVYKVEKYLRKCVDSILVQTYKNLEIILVDDGSPDNCGKICDEYAAKDSRIKVIHQQNGGLSAARNAGLDIATGEYIGFVDSDDYIAPDMYEKLYEALKKAGADLAVCNFIYVDSGGNDLKYYPPYPSKIYKGKDIMRLFAESDCVCFVTTVNRLYKKQLFFNLRFEIGKTNEDEFIAHKIFCQCNTVVFIENTFYYYLKREDSIMGSPVTIKRADGVEAIYNRLQYLKENCPEVDIAKASRAFFGAYRGFKSRFTPVTEYDFRRLAEIDKMADETYNQVKYKCDWKTRLFFECRPIYMFLYKIKLFLKR